MVYYSLSNFLRAQMYAHVHSNAIVYSYSLIYKVAFSTV